MGRWLLKVLWPLLNEVSWWPKRQEIKEEGEKATNSREDEERGGRRQHGLETEAVVASHERAETLAQRRIRWVRCWIKYGLGSGSINLTH